MNESKTLDRLMNLDLAEIRLKSALRSLQQKRMAICSRKDLAKYQDALAKVLLRLNQISDLRKES